MPFAPPSTDSGLDRRSFLRLAGLGSAALLAPAWPSRGASYDPAACRLMEFDVSYQTVIHKLPTDAEEVRVWIPLPSDDYAQDITALEIDSPLPFTITEEPAYGSRMIHVATKKDLRPFSVTVGYHVTRRRAGIQPATLDPRHAAKFLALADPVRVTDEVEAFAKQCIGGATDPYDIGRRVFDGIQEILFYDRDIPGCGLGDTAWIMRHRRGKCDDYHALFMAVMVSRGVPVRWEQGFPLPFPDPGQAAAGRLEGDCTGAHCWASFHAPPRGWVPVDVSEADKAGRSGAFFFGNLSPNRFQVSVGRGVTLNPAQGAGPLPTFAFAYAEADGIPLIYTTNYENAIKYTVTRVEMS